ncbi:MAG: bifunctional homocysteine S-methyltransferase/methylenetetrahydrofolate reductase [Acidobacteria bacterium]|nr:MAG: bifunctional homocysteine S-methyltransferase/methylenetetrahydrofolate reductase [Acidobacteriota bacterium]
MRDFLSELRNRVLICDGAMGTMLYSKGIFISRCFDELNLSKPELVREVHLDYVKAGVDIIETNTFGSNRTKLMSHGLEAQMREINVQGARIAREAAGDDIFVAGAIGPLGIRIEPWGKTSIDDARAIFRQQAEALLEGGAGIFILETFSDLNEVFAAIRGVRDVSDRPLVAQMSIEEDGNSLEGTPPEVFTRRLEEWGADVLGLNCSVGPHTMLESIERIASVTAKKLSVQPNAGKPKNIEGRNIYLCSPEYMASYAKKFVEYGVSIVGGCCGTTPQHIKAIRSAVRSVSPPFQPSPAASRLSSASGAMAAYLERGRGESSDAIPLEQRSRLGYKIARGEFVRMVEMIPPMGHDFSQAIERAKYLQAHNVDAINVTDAPRSSARMSAISLAILLKESTEIESLAHYTCRDRNLLGMQADLLGAYALGLRNLLLITGDPRLTGDYIDATTVFDVDSIGLTNMVHRLNRGIDVGGKSIGKPTGFVIGVGANPGAIKDDDELKRFHYKVEAGAQFVLTQPVFDQGVLEQFLRRIEDCKIPVIAGILPLANHRAAEFLNYEVPGCSVPDSILERMRRADNPEPARAEGIRIAQDILERIQGMVQGVQVRGPFDEYETPVEVLSVLNLKGASR